jgi:hypothetical protein
MQVLESFMQALREFNDWPTDKILTSVFPFPHLNKCSLSGVLYFSRFCQLKEFWMSFNCNNNTHFDDNH